METKTIKASVLQENLSKALSLVSRAVANRSTLPVLSNVLLSVDPDGILTLQATNLEMGITTCTDAKTEEAGAITLPARLFGDLINSFPPERVDLYLKEGTHTLNIRCGRMESNIKGRAAEEFPVVPTFQDVTPAYQGGVTLPVEQLRVMIDKTVFAAARDESRPILTGVLIKLESDRLTMAAADGFRLNVTSQNGMTGLPETQVIVPARAMVELSRLIGNDTEPVTVVIQGERRQILFHTERADMVSQLIEGNFPDFTQIIPKSHTTRIVVDRGELLKGVRISNLFARDSANIVKFEVRPSGDELLSGRVTLLSTSAELGDNVAEIDASIEGPELDIAFNTVYLREAVEAVEGPTLAMEFNEASSPGVIRDTGDGGWVHTIMPMNVQR